MCLLSNSSDSKLLPQRVLPPVTTAGIAKYQGILTASGVHEIIVSGTLPKGETTGNVTYWIIDRDTNAIVSQVVLPDVAHDVNCAERVDFRNPRSHRTSTVSAIAADAILRQLNGLLPP